jgi:hypothetical protein
MERTVIKSWARDCVMVLGVVRLTDRLDVGVRLDLELGKT